MVLKTKLKKLYLLKLLFFHLLIYKKYQLLHVCHSLKHMMLQKEILSHASKYMILASKQNQCCKNTLEELQKRLLMP